MKARKITSLVLASAMAMTLAAGFTVSAEETTEAESSADTSVSYIADYTNEELGIVNGKFTETHSITVEVYDRSNDGGTPPDTNVFAQYIIQHMLDEYNVEVTFQTVPRWTEPEVMNNLLASDGAPDVCVTYSYPTILTYAEMGGVIDLNEYLTEYADLIPNLTNCVTPEFLTYDQDPDTGSIWCIEGRISDSSQSGGQRMFVRKDWLDALGLEDKLTYTVDEFEQLLYTFQENAETLLGDEADQMIPFFLTSDVGWTDLDLAYAMLPGDLTGKELYCYGYDDRKFMYPNYKEVVRKLNEWYNNGLIWKDFALYDAADTTGTNLVKSGYVGAFCQNADQPYRDGEDGIQLTLQRMVSEDASYVAVDLVNEDGVVRRYSSEPVDRKVFFPATNDEPIASLMYLDFISRPDTLVYLQTGEEGINSEKQADGSYILLNATGDYIFNSNLNIDYTITNNGINLGDPEIDIETLANGYEGIDPSYIERAYNPDTFDIVYVPNPKLGEITAETNVGTSLTELRDATLCQSVVCSTDEFDTVYDSQYQAYLDAGGQAIIDERTEKWEAAYGDATDID